MDTQPNPPSWGLDRIDQRNLPLDQSYTYPTTASAVHAYIIDTGVRITHTQFGVRATSGFDAVDGRPADDCHGHSTHVAGTVGGTDYGVAKAVQLVAVSPIAIAGCGRNGRVASTVEVHIVHTYRGDLRIDLVAPDGTAYRLKNISFFDSADNVDATYTVNLSSEAGDGNWRLRVQDFFGGDVGFINTWTLTL